MKVKIGLIIILLYSCSNEEMKIDYSLDIGHQWIYKCVISGRLKEDSTNKSAIEFDTLKIEEKKVIEDFEGFKISSTFSNRFSNENSISIWKITDKYLVKKTYYIVDNKIIKRSTDFFPKKFKFGEIEKYDKYHTKITGINIPVKTKAGLFKCAELQILYNNKTDTLTLFISQRVGVVKSEYKSSYTYDNSAYNYNSNVSVLEYYNF